MGEPLEDLAVHWRATQDAASTVALCEALTLAPNPALTVEVCDAARARYAGDGAVLLAAARALVASNQLVDAQATLVAAGKLDPQNVRIFRCLGEVLLRRGDAERAERILERALQLRPSDGEARAWIERARALRVLQARSGLPAVAERVARDVPLPSPVDLRDPTSEAETMVRPMPEEWRRATAPPDPEDLEDEQGNMPTRAMAAAAPPARQPSAVAPPVLQPSAVAPAAPEPVALPPRTGAAVIDREALGLEPARASVEHGEAPVAPAMALAPREDRVPDPRDVLDALALAGIFEPPQAAALAPTAWDRALEKPRRRGARALVAAVAVFVAAAGGTFSYVEHQRAQAHTEAEGLLAGAEQEIVRGAVAGLGTLDAVFNKVFELDSRSPRAALAWLRERGMRGIVVRADDIAFEAAIARALDVGVKDDSIAFARVASFLFQGDTAGAAALLAKWDGASSGDAFYQLMAGATLEQAGDSRALARYAASAQALDDLAAAHIGLVRVTALEGDPAKATELAAQFKKRWPDRAEGEALVALAWALQPARPEPPPPEVDGLDKRTDELPHGLRAVPDTLAAIRALSARKYDDARARLERALAHVATPGLATWVGHVALDAEDEEIARRAALAAVRFSAAYVPARTLAARVALLGERTDEALKATEDLDGALPEVAVVRAATAYERIDVDGLQRALDAAASPGREVPILAALAVAPDVLGGRAKAHASSALALGLGDAPWGDLVAMDLALDMGDTTTAQKIAERWKDAEQRPSRAVRLARLARYTDKLDVAEAMSSSALSKGTATVRAVAERVLVLVARGKGGEVPALLARSPAVLGTAATWLSAYALASSGKADDARGKLAALDVPPETAALPIRTIAALALAAAKDKKRAQEVVKSLRKAGIDSRDVAAAAALAGVRKGG